jgi:hypothetical protein
MSCGYSRETLALFIENDLPRVQNLEVSRHVHACMECRETCIQLESSQSLIKGKLRARFDNPPAEDLLLAVRQTVFSRIRNEAQTLGWAIQLERALLIGFRKHGFAFASVALLAIVSASMLAEMRFAGSGTQAVGIAVFEGKDVLIQPARYREWVFVGTMTGLSHSSPHETSQSLQNVYVNPAAYKEYARTGAFPEGTVLVLERVHGENKAVQLQASVKDSSRFQGGWGFFDFTGKEGETAPKAQALPDGTCRPCHEMHGQKDHVFTQFYPFLRSARVES